MGLEAEQLTSQNGNSEENLGHRLFFGRKQKGDLFKCSEILEGCNKCIHKNLGLTCYFCEIDSECHDIGSLVSPCAPPSADNKCVSKSPESNC